MALDKHIQTRKDISRKLVITKKELDKLANKGEIAAYFSKKQEIKELKDELMRKDKHALVKFYYVLTDGSHCNFHYCPKCDLLGSHDHETLSKIVFNEEENKAFRKQVNFGRINVEIFEETTNRHVEPEKILTIDQARESRALYGEVERDYFFLPSSVPSVYELDDIFMFKLEEKAKKKSSFFGRQ